MKKIVLGLTLLASAFNVIAIVNCDKVIVEDSILNTGEITSQGVSKYPLEFLENGNLMMIKMHGVNFDFQTSPVRNDKWKEGDKMQMRTGLIETSEASNQLIYIKDGETYSGIQMVIKVSGKQRSLMGVDCVVDSE